MHKNSAYFLPCARDLWILAQVCLLWMTAAYGCSSIQQNYAHVPLKPHRAANFDSSSGNGGGSKPRRRSSADVAVTSASHDVDSSWEDSYREEAAVSLGEDISVFLLRRSMRFSGGAVFRDRKVASCSIASPSTTQQLNHRFATDSADRSGREWPEIRRVLKKCLARAGSGGLPGAAAGVLQVFTFMWLRTVVNYQCRYGTSMAAATGELYRQGGVLRFYRGISFALVSNPLSRFGMAAANEGAIALGDAMPWPVSVAFTTWIASLLAGAWRVMLTPLDTCKTVLQVEGPQGFALLTKKVWSGNIGCLYQGVTAAAAATALGYFPWLLTFNYLNARLKKPSAVGKMLLRNAIIGLASSISSDVCTNSIRVLKTMKQAAAVYDASITYRKAAALVIESDGWKGLLGRGLTTRILANGLQSMLFTVVWRYLHDKYIVPRREAAALQARKALEVPSSSVVAT